MDATLNRILETMREHHGTQKALADFLGISGNNITDWKSGRNKSYRLYLPQISEYYGVSLDWLTGHSDIKTKPAADGYELSDMDIQFIKILPKLSDREKAMLLAQIDALLKMQEQE